MPPKTLPVSTPTPTATPTSSIGMAIPVPVQTPDDQDEDEDAFGPPGPEFGFFVVGKWKPPNCRSSFSSIRWWAS